MLSLSDFLHQVLSEFSIIHPVRTDSDGRLLSASVSAHRLHRNKRQAPSTDDTNFERQTRADTSPRASSVRSLSGRGHADEEVELFYNVTVFGQELHLQLRPNTRLVAPAATMEWEESGRFHSQPIGDVDCLYTGTVSNMEDTFVAISNCDGLVGVT